MPRVLKLRELRGKFEEKLFWSWSSVVCVRKPSKHSELNSYYFYGVNEPYKCQHVVLCSHILGGRKPLSSGFQISPFNHPGKNLKCFFVACLHSLKTNGVRTWQGRPIPKGDLHLPTIHFQVLWLLVSGRVTPQNNELNESNLHQIYETHWQITNQYVQLWGSFGTPTHTILPSMYDNMYLYKYNFVDLYGKWVGR